MSDARFDAPRHAGAAKMAGKVVVSLVFGLLIGGAALAQEAASPVGEVVGTLPKGHFLENVTADAQGALFMTDYVGRTILRYHGDDGLRLIRALDLYPVGIERAETGLVVTAHSESLLDGTAGTGPNLILEMTADGEISDSFAVPGALFLNGIEQLEGSRFLVADSLRGVVFLVDTAENAARIWLEDARLEPADPASHVPAANGIKIRDGLAYISNSARGLLLSVPVEDPRPETLEIVLDDTVIDDFVFADDGTLFATTHSKDVLRISPDFEVGVFADEAQGIAGGTAAEIVEEADGTFLYVVGDGGLFEGLELQAPAVVRLAIE